MIGEQYQNLAASSLPTVTQEAAAKSSQSLSVQGVPNQIKAWCHPVPPQPTEKSCSKLKLIQIENAQTTMLLRFSLCKTMLQVFYNENQ